MKSLKIKFAYGAAGVIVAAVFAAIIVALIQLNSVSAHNSAVQTELLVAIRSLNGEVQSLKQKQKEQGSGENFTKAVIEAIETYGAKKQAQIAQQKLDEYKNAPKELIDGKHIYGDLQARFTLVEFSDLECSYCKRFHPTVKELVDQSNGQVNWEWRHMPLSFHDPVASVQAHAAECVGELADNRAFWVYLGDIFEHSAGNGQGTNELLRLALDLGVDGEAFKSCMQEARYDQKIKDDIAMGVSLGFNGTPSSVLTDNHTGKTLPLNGAQPKSAILSAIRSMQDAAQ